MEKKWKKQAAAEREYLWCYYDVLLLLVILTILYFDAVCVIFCAVKGLLCPHASPSSECNRVSHANQPIVDLSAGEQDILNVISYIHFQH